MDDSKNPVEVWRKLLLIEFIFLWKTNKYKNDYQVPKSSALKNEEAYLLFYIRKEKHERVNFTSKTDVEKKVGLKDSEIRDKRYELKYTSGICTTSRIVLITSERSEFYCYRLAFKFDRL